MSVNSANDLSVDVVVHLILFGGARGGSTGGVDGTLEGLSTHEGLS